MKPQTFLAAFDVKHCTGDMSEKWETESITEFYVFNSAFQIPFKIHLMVIIWKHSRERETTN